MKKQIAIVGAGRLGRTLARALRLKGYRIGPVVTRSKKTAQAAVRFIGAGKALAKPGAELLASDIVIIGTPDDRIVPTTKALAKLEGNWRGKVVLHLSGAVSSEEFVALKKRGAAVGTMHPIYPFPQTLKKFPRRVVFGVEGSAGAVRTATSLVRTVGGVAVKVRAKDKALYHAAAAMVAGHLTTQMDLGVRMMQRAGIARSVARRVLLPLIEQTVKGYAGRGEKSWVGPLERGDLATVRKHLRSLEKLPPYYRDAYTVLAQAAVTLYRSPGSQSTKALQRLLRKGK